MDYEIVYLKEKIVTGIKIRTNNNDPAMKNDISNLWKRFLEDGIYQSIPNKRNENIIGLYTNYESNFNGDYDAMICFEVLEEKKFSKKVEVKKITAGKYAKFIIKGNNKEAVAEFWAKLWTMELDRKYTFDFEEYQTDWDMNNREINVYISIN
ncbi:GyrI-like domain-containing protein [Clostridium sp. BL-8]|uniref:GyrI-like domain-containing protein n=1 Tax=Clostridium sp. BL-8 TaxID=349938 RepID=UPI00098CBDEF|nr:GyrI-like domain-containing protein [Clostridium sp. BL-8]OOM81257.1 bacterial transcription activator, effector binding domain [Clostridium sp. BL-8]